MKHVFTASYKTFYIWFVGFLWVVAIGVAVVENGFLASWALKTALLEAGVECKSVRGGLFSGFTITQIEYDKKATASEVILRPALLPLLEGQIAASLLSVKNLKVDEKWLQEQLEKPSEKPQWPNTIRIDRADISLLSHKYGEVTLKSASLKAKSFFYDFKNFKADFDVDIATDLIELQAQGETKEGNATAKGSLRAGGGQLINRLADDVDFDFNALKDTPFELSFDGRMLNAKTLIHDSGIVYKYDIDARVLRSDTRVTFDTSNYRFKVENDGEFACRYGLVRGKFDVIYDGEHTTYGGTAKITRFDLIPLGRFAKWVKVNSASNEEAHFAGNAKEARVWAKATAEGTIHGVPVRVLSSDTLVYSHFRSKLVKVETRALCDSGYGSFEITNRYEEPLKGFKVSGNMTVKQPRNLPFDASLLQEGSAHFEADENSLAARFESPSGYGKVTSRGFDRYDFSLYTPQLLFSKLYTKLPSSIASGSGRFEVHGYYDDPTSLTLIKANLHDAKLGNKPLEADEIVIKHTSDNYELNSCKLKIGKSQITITGSLDNGLLNAKASAPYLDATLNGTTKEKLNYVLHISDATQAADLVRQLAALPRDLENQRIEGSVNLSGQILNAIDAPSGTMTADSKELKVGELVAKNIAASASYRDKTVEFDSFAVTILGKEYRLSKGARILIGDDQTRLENFKIGNMLFFDGIYTNGNFNGSARVRGFEYNDPKVARAIINADTKLRFSGKNLHVDGDANLSNLQIFYVSRGSQIAKDKDIRIVRAKKHTVATDWFLDHVSANILLHTDKKVEYKTKEMQLSLLPHLMIYKEAGKKQLFLGLLRLDSGIYNFEGRKFAILGGDISLRGEEENSYLNLKLALMEDDTKITVGVQGFAASPKLSFASQPAMSEREIISYLLFGVEADRSFTQSRSEADYSSKAIGVLSSVLSRDLAMEFGVKLDKIEISPSDTQRTSGARGTTKVEVGKRLSKDLMIIYKNDIDSSVVLQYRLNKHIGAESEVGSKRGSVDIFYKQDY